MGETLPQNPQDARLLELAPWPPGGGAKPYIRWWWLAGPFRPEDIDEQLQWIQVNGFGGAEVAWLWPVWLQGGEPLHPVPEWLGAEWRRLVAHTKATADRLGLGCDFTFGSCWPFGGSCVQPKDAAQRFLGLSSQQMHCTWESSQGADEFVLDHLSREAFDAYAGALLPAFRPALRGRTSALFCDSLEIDLEGAWHPRLWDAFAHRFGYRLEPFSANLSAHPDVHFDYRRFISDTLLNEFFEPFARMCQTEGAVSRVQCHGGLTDLLAAYATVHVAESEALLFEPHFSRLAASATALASRTVVSCEQFTALYGLPRRNNLQPLQYWRKDQLADLKLLADAVFANGVNQVIWHGMPFNGRDGRNEFYAAVHIGPDAPFADQLPSFNQYLERVSSLLRGKPEFNVAAYLPLEDTWMSGEIPREERTPAARYHWELRGIRPPRQLEPYHPCWISLPFLKAATVHQQRLHVGRIDVGALFVDSRYVTLEALREIVRLADEGLPIILKRIPEQPGRVRSAEYPSLLNRLTKSERVHADVETVQLTPLVEGDNLPPYWCCREGNLTTCFFAHPATRSVRYPLRYLQSEESVAETRAVRLRAGAQLIERELLFEPQQSLALQVSDEGAVTDVDIRWISPCRPN